MLSIMAGGMHVTLQRQASISPGLIDPSYRKADGGVAHTPKIKALCDDIISHFSNDGQGGSDAKPIVVFCSYPQKAYPIIRKAMAERGIDPSIIDTIAGDVAPHERGYMQDKLNKGHSKVLLVGTMSGGAGLNLQEKANKTLFLDEPWNPAAKRQAQGRVWRTGQNNPVHERTYRMNDTYDLAVEMKLAGKQAMVHALLGKQLPTEETFSVDNSVAAVVGRSKGGDFSEDQIKAMMDNASKYDMGSNEHKQATKLLEQMGEDWENTLSEGGHGGVAATLTDKDFEPNQEKQQTLKNKGAHALTKKFDEKEFRANWELDRKKRMSKQTLEMATLMQKLYTEKGDKERSEMYAKKVKAAQEFIDGKDKKEEKKPKSTDAKEGKSKSGGEGEAKPAQPKQNATATVAEAEQRKNAKTSTPEAKQKAKETDKRVQTGATGRPGKPSQSAQEAHEETAKPTPVKMAKVTHANEPLGLQFHSKKNPFTDGSAKKVKGTDISHNEAHYVLHTLSKEQPKNWSEYLKKHIKPIWDTEDGANPYSDKSAQEWIDKVVSAIEGQGVLSRTEGKLNKEKKNAK
jgi:hypothetical protein